MRKIRKFMISSQLNKHLSAMEMLSIAGGVEWSNVDIFKCTCSLTKSCGSVYTRTVNVKATSQSPAESGVLRNDCQGYTSASCQFLYHINGIW